MKLQKLSDEVKAETKYCPFRLYNKETKIEAHEEMVSTPRPVGVIASRP